MEAGLLLIGAIARSWGRCKAIVRKGAKCKNRSSIGIRLSYEENLALSFVLFFCAYLKFYIPGDQNENLFRSPWSVGLGPRRRLHSGYLLLPASNLSNLEIKMMIYLEVHESWAWLHVLVFVIVGPIVAHFMKKEMRKGGSQNGPKK